METTTESEFKYSERTSKQQKFDKRLIAHVVMQVEQGVPRRDLLKEYGMSRCTLEDWLQKHGSFLKGKRYSPSERRTVVRAVASGMSIREAQIAFKISYPSVIRDWIRKFKEENVEISDSKPVEMSKKVPIASENTAIQALQKALEEANLKIKALDTLIDIAQEQLKIDIRKKSGARQSSK